MKKRYLFLLTLLIGNVIHAQHFYYHKGQKIPIRTSPNKILVKFSANSTELQKSNVLSKHIPSKHQLRKEPKTHDRFHLTEIHLADGRTMASTLNELRKEANVELANPLFTYKDSTELSFTDEFFVKLKSPIDYQLLEKLSVQTNTEIVKQDEHDLTLFVVKTNKASNGNALEMANFFQEQGLFVFSEPNFVRIKASKTNDPYFNDQWSLANTGQYGGTAGSDMNVVNAWTITSGKPTIKVAVLDVGVDLVHPDLVGNLVFGYDATGANSYGAPSGNDAHGTACAGIIASKGNNSIGTVGVSPNCKIMPVRIAVANVFIDNNIVNGINWAVAQGADVLSCSWGGGPPSSAITNAINNATTNGRGGLGCVVVFSAGNEDNGTVSFPANLPNVMAVGAMSMCNQRKSKSSCDGEDWGSNYGAEIDLVAPGVAISTTDISGPNGYNATGQCEPYNNDYVRKFNGTSSACPNVAGVAALVLSVNRCLPQSEVQKILKISCDKVGTYCYKNNPSSPNGSWNKEMGHGRLNAFLAVRYAYGNAVNVSSNISGSDQGPVGFFPWNLQTNECAGLAAANYYVRRHEVRATVSYPYSPGTVLVGTSNGLSAASPNDGSNYMGITDVTPTSATLFTYVYETMTITGASLGFVPTRPENIRFNFAVMGTVTENQYLQNETVTTQKSYNVRNMIIAGNNVTTTLPTGDYTIKSGTSVQLTAGNTVVWTPGFKAETGSSVIANILPPFVCSQYPQGRMENTSETTSETIENALFSSLGKAQPSMELTGGYAALPFPNPISSGLLHFGRSVGSYTLLTTTGKVLHQGTNADKLDVTGLPKGLYMLQLDDKTEKVIVQ